MIKKLGLIAILGMGIMNGCASTPQKYNINPEVIFISNHKDPMWGRGEKFYKERLKKNPNDWKAHLYFAEGFMENARPKEAIPHYESLWRILPQDKIPQLAYFHLQEAYDALGRKEDSLEIAKFALKKWPHDPMVWRHLAQRYDDFGMWKEAINAWMKKRSLKNRAVSKFRNLNINSKEEIMAEDIIIARDYANLGQYDEALKIQEKMIERFPKKSLGYELRGAIYKKMGRYEDALGDFKKVYEIDKKIYPKEDLEDEINDIKEISKKSKK